MQLPPTRLVQEALQKDVLPPFLAAAVVFAAVVAVLGRRAAPAAAVLALAAGWAAGNWSAAVVPWRPDGSRAAWVPWLAAAAAAAGLLARVPRLPAGVGWAAWSAVIAFAAVRLVPAEYQKAPWWAVPAFVLVNAAVGFGPARLSRREPGAGVPLAGAAALFAAGTVLIHAHSGRLMESAVIAGSALAGLAAVAVVTRADAGSAMPAAAVFLTGLLLAGYHETYSEVPAAAFALPASAPLAALAPLPGRLTGGRRRLLQFFLVLVPLAAAVWLAARAEPLDFENL